MSIEERIRHLLKAALRADEDGSDRIARTLRRMAHELRPLDVNLPPRLQECCGD